MLDIFVLQSNVAFAYIVHKSIDFNYNVEAFLQPTQINSSKLSFELANQLYELKSTQVKVRTSISENIQVLLSE